MDRTGWIRITAGAALLGVAAWLVSWAAILLAGGVEGPLDAVAFFVGFALVLVGSVSLTLRLTRGRSPLVTGAAVAAGMVVTFLLVPGLSIVSSGLLGDETFAGAEGGLMVLAAVALLVGLTGLRDRGQATAMAGR